MFSAFVKRRRWATVVVFLFLGPVVGMLYLGKGRLALAYFSASLLAYAAPWAAAYFSVLDADPKLVGDLLLWSLHLPGALHGYVIAKPIAGTQPKAWFARWYAISGLVLVSPVALAVVVRSLLWEPFYIPAGSMKPTLVVGDHLWASKYAYGYSRFSLPFAPPVVSGRVFGREPQRGDVVLFKVVMDGRPVDYIKRVIGLPGERIQMRQGRLHISDRTVAREPVGTETMTGRDGSVRQLVRYEETLPNGRRHLILEESDDRPLDNTTVYTVPDGHYFVLGDNRDWSLDSRVAEFGFMPYENLIGRFEAVFWNSVDRKIRFERRL
ncbi:signal peptidase I [Shumkonia mesophila]|uniref:signal peptidase I n=1 Tax=Shumkonia mesophila TaxID=2838854 RepID=UPI00293520AD|nr:signal peptidase I [Shumkonia mesophila]